MTRYRLEDFKEGWWIGDFPEAVFRTRLFEAAYKVHKAGEDWPEHYQKEALELNLLIRGIMTIGDQRFVEGDIFIVNPLEKLKPHFTTDCEVMVVKVPSLPGDKIVCS